MNGMRLIDLIDIIKYMSIFPVDDFYSTGKSFYKFVENSTSNISS